MNLECFRHLALRYLTAVSMGITVLSFSLMSDAMAEPKREAKPVKQSTPTPRAPTPKTAQPPSAAPTNSGSSETKTESNGDSKAETKEGAKSGSGNINTSMKEMFGGEGSAKGAPLLIKSDTLELNSKDRVFTYRGNVEIVRDDVRITAKLVEGRYGTDNQLQTVLCTGDVVITKGDGMKATANRGLYRVPAAVMELTEGPELYRDGNVLAADKVTVFLNEDRSEAEGNVRVKVIKPNDTAQ